MDKFYKNIDRRNFLKLASLSYIPFALGKYPLSYYPNTLNINDPDNDKILVIIQLQGGNDGLNTLFDFEEYSNLFKVRQNIIIPENQIISLGGRFGLHPSMTGFKNLWENEQLGIILNVGYPNQNRSHFRSTDIWNSGSGSLTTLETGWLGRYFEHQHPTYPYDFPNEEYPHPFVLTIGHTISETCQGSKSALGINVEDPLNIITNSDVSLSTIPNDCYGAAIQYMINTSNQATAYGLEIEKAAKMGNNISDLYGNSSSELGQKLKKVARLISGGLKTKVYIVELGGFDTHDLQSDPNNPLIGVHANLLQELSDSIYAFQDDLIKLNIDHRVMGMTYSEFGRQIRSNGAFGTDHGNAAPLFLFGSCVKSQIKGDPFKIDPNIDNGAGVPHQVDFRYVYGTMLSKWLGSDISVVRQILFDEFENIDILTDNCHLDSSIFNQSLSSLDLMISPNPVQNVATISSSNPFRFHKALLMNNIGNIVYKVDNKSWNDPVSEFQIDLTSIQSGIYYLNIQGIHLHKTIEIVKI